MPLNQAVQEEERKRREREAAQAAQRQAMEQAAQQHAAQQQSAQQQVTQQPSAQQPQSAQQQLQYKQEPQQQNKWYQGSQPTFNESLARVYTISKTDYNRGKQLYDQLMGFASDPTSNFYNPYSSGTNQAIYQLHALGYDMSKGVTKEWIAKNAYLQQYYRTGTSGTPLAPTKTSTKEQNAAYWYYQILKAEDTTEKAELEWNALREEIAYWTARQDRNYSDDEILAKIDWSKYKTLTGLDADRANGTPTKLNRGIGYSQDNLRGVIWAARNGGGTGNAQMDAVKAILGEGKGYTMDESLHGSDDPTSPNYNPYGYASTMDEAAKYFNVYGFGEDWLEKNKGILTGNDETAKKYYQQIASAEKTTKKAEEEWKSLRKDIAYWASRLDRNYTDEEVLAHIDWGKYKTLANLDEDRKTGTPTALTRGIGYSQQGMQDTLDFVRSYGVGYQENEDIRSRRDPTSDKYSPYSVGSTLDDAALYFNVSGFGPQWLEENRAILNSTDATQKAMYKKVYKAEQTTLAAEKELQELWDDVYTKLKFSNDADYILNGLLDGRNTLKRMDESMKYGDLQSGDLLETTRAINYRWQDVEDFVRKACEKQKTEMQGPVYVQNVTDALNGVSTQGTQTTTQSGGAPVPQGDTGMVVSSTKDAAAKEAAPTFMTKGTEEEKLVAQWSWPVATPEYISTITDAIQNGTMTGTDVVRQAQYNADSYTAKNYLDILKGKGDYTKLQKEIDGLIKERDALQSSLNPETPVHQEATTEAEKALTEAMAGGAGENYGGQSYLDFFETLKNGYQAWLNSDEDNPVLDGIYDNVSEETGRKLEDLIIGSLSGQRVGPDSISGIITQIANEMGISYEQAPYAEAPTPNYDEMSAEQKRLTDLNYTIEKKQDELSKLQDAYDEALEKEKILNGNYDSVAKLAGINAADDSGLRNLTTVMDYIYQVGSEYAPTQYTAYSLYDAAMQGDDAASYEQVVSAAKEGQAAYRAAIQNIDYAFKMAERYQIELPDEYVKNLNRAKARYEREAKAADYFIMRGNEDFASTVDQIKKEITGAWDGPNFNDQPKGGYSDLDRNAVNPEAHLGQFIMEGLGAQNTSYMTLMTQEERDTYLYIRAKQGEDAAKEYYDYLTGDYGVIKTRAAENLRANVSEGTKSGFWAGLGLNALRAIMAPGELQGTAKAVIDTISGRETNPYDPAFGAAIFRGAVSQATKEEIDKIDNPTWKTVANIGYDVGSSMADNVVNMVTFGGLGAGIGNAVLSNFVSAVPMALEAAGSTMQSAREAGASQMQMLALGGASFLAESLTEAVTVGNIKDAFTKGTKEEFVHSISQLFIGALKDMGEEAMGEGASEAFEGIMQNLIYDRLDGLSLEDVGEKDLQEILSDSAYAAFLGAISGGIFKVTGDIFTGNTKHAIQMQFIAQTKGMTGSQYADSLNEQISRMREAEANQTPAGEAPQGEVAGPMPKAGPMPQGEVAGPMPQGEATGPMPDADLVSRKVAALNEAMGTEDVASKTTTVAAVLSDGNNDMMQSATMQALSTHLADRIGADESVSLVRDIMMTASESGINQDALTKALTTAVLGNGGASSMLDVMVSEGVTPDTIGQMMMAAGMDSTNQTVQQNIQKAVEENQIATRTKEIYAETAGQLDNAKTEVSNAKADVQKATTDLEEQHRLFDAFKKKMDTIKDNLLKNAGNQNNYKALEGALGKLESQNTAVKQREQALEDANHRLQEAQGRLDGQENALLQQAREQAQQEVVARNEQYRQDQQVIEEQNALALQAQQENNNVATMDADSFTDNVLQNNGYDVTDEEREQVREVFRRIQSELGPEAMQRRSRFVDQVSKKFGIDIVFADTTKGGTVSRQNGYYDRRSNRIVLDQNATIGDAMYFVAGHELTHVAEQSGTYNDLAASLLRIQYGDEIGDFQEFLKKVESGEIRNQAAMDILGKQQFYNNRLAAMHEQDNSIDATPLTSMEAAQEVVADIMGSILKGDENLINQLAAEEPSTARRILDSIKSFLKKLVGIDGEWKSDTQRVVDMLETALKDAQGQIGDNVKYLITPANEPTHLKDQIRNASEQLRKMNPVGSATTEIDLAPYYQKGARSEEAAYKMWANEVAESYGRTVSRDDFGTAKISGSSISRAFSYFAYHNKAYVAAFKLIPNVVEKGIRVDYHENHKGGQATSYTYAAPVEIDGTIGDMGVVMRKIPGKNSLKTYKILLPNGEEFVIEDKKTEEGNRYKSNPEGMEAHPTASASEIIIPEADADFNTQTDQNSQKEAQPVVKDDHGESVVSELPGGTITRDVSNSLSSWTEEEQVKTRAALEEKGFATEDIDKWMQNVNGIASMVAEDRQRLDFEADETKSMVKPNADYGASIDASTLCAKRLLYQGTFDAIQHVLANTPLMPADLIDLANMMREMGYETPCGICYVESRRRILGQETQKWLDSYEGEYKPRIEEVTTSDGLEKLKNEHPQAYEDFLEAMKNLNQRNPKVVQLRTDYRGEIKSMTDAAVQRAIDHGGLRVQSFSDFETPHLLDMIQVIYDMAAKALTSQAYTKVANFAWAFGGTGMKINLSEIAKGEGFTIEGGHTFKEIAAMPYEEAKKLISLLYDDVEGMKHADVIALRNRYGEDVGSIIVGKNDAHIIAAMGDSEIDFIIPFHRSGWTKKERNLMETLKGYQDYTNDQNERKIIGRKANGKGYKTAPAAKSKIKNFEPVGEKTANGKGQNGYWDFSKSGMENAETYLQMCKEDGRIPKFSRFLVDNGDGSFSLPQGDDYRSTCIREGYWKTLIDFKMYDNNGVGSPQRAVTPNINMDEARRILNEYSLDRNGVTRKSNNDLPVAQPVVDRFVEEFKEKHPRTKYSLPAEQYEQEYQEAVASGNKDWQAMVVNQAAYASGYTVGAYHGSPVTDITSFNTRSEEGKKQKLQLLFGTHFTQNKAYADLYAKKAKGSKGTSRMALNRFGRVYDVNLDLGKSLDLRTARNYTEGDEMYQLYKDLPANIQKKIPAHTFTAYETELGMGSGEYVTASMIERALDMMSPKDATDFLVDHGYNSVLYLADYSTGMANNRMTRDPSIIMLDPERIKSADPITYDDSGKPIPLSERFNNQSKDIRYSLPEGRIQRDTNYSLPSAPILEDMIRQYIAQGGMLSTNVTPPGTGLPGPVAGGSTGPVRQRQFGSQTAQRSDALHDDVKQYLREHSAYNADSNRAQIDRSIEWVRSHASEQDTDGYYAAMDEILDPNFNSMSADGQARMLTVMSMAALKGDVASETRIADAYNQQGTRLGQAMQARKIFNLMTPLGRISVLKKTMNNLNQRYIDQGKSTRVNLSDETLKKAGEARTAEEFREVQKQAYKELAEQMPSDWKEKLRSMRYFSMLFNPVTHIRNVLGNAGFMPAIAFKNTIGTGLEHLYQGKIERSGDMRTKALVASKENRAFAKADAIAMKDELTGEAKFNQADPVQQERKMFGKSIFGKAFQGLIDFNSNLLEAEDWAFLQKHYANALSGWMQANNVTPAQMKGTLLDQARAYAIQEAQKATYRDASKFASMMSDISRKGGPAGFLVDAALPFKKTPTNILKRGIEYSPIGLMKTVLVDSHKLKLYNQWVKNGSEGNMPSKAISPTQYIDRIASGLSGTGIAAMGALMSAMGWLKVGLDDDDEIAKQNGEQEYALKVSLFGQDVSYTIDWLAPSSMPLFVGASIYNELMKERKEGDELEVASGVIDSVLMITEPVFNLSMLDGVNSLFQTNNWRTDAGNNLTDIGATVATNYVTSFVPTLAGKVARTMDTTRRETYVTPGTGLTRATIERTWQKILAKVPGATDLLKPYVSPFGEEEKASTVAAVLQNFVSPGYFKSVEISDMEKEMQRLYEATGEKTVVPKQPAKYFQVDGEKLNLNAEQYTTLQKTRGTLAKDLLNQVVNSPEYQIYGDAVRVEMIDDAWKYCTEMAKKEVEPSFKLTNWVAGAGDDPLKALITRREEAAKAGYIAQHKTSLLKALDEEDMDTAQASIEGLKKCGKDEKYVKGFVSDHYRPLYIEAVKNNDMDTAMDIQMTLMQMNIGYTKKNFSDWIKNAKKKEGEE